ncbi:carbohydrate sulfotransferase 15 isoform X1 [Patella vulgata]|uniref:carbohydrate sulfotransferase 15 isoform X1 n=2 Tax=Patella vulgata TaxID=6465 RepID=UPI0021800ED4|nr:carbohydrate sulfotransferase 15 isoform X1 [Patella vulgata]
MKRHNIQAILTYREGLQCFKKNDMFRFRLKRLSIAGIIIFIVVLIYNSNNRVQQQTYTHREVLDKMNVYDEFGELSEKRQKLIEEQLKQNNVIKQSNGVEDDQLEQHGESDIVRKMDVLKNKRNIDYSRYTDVLSMQRPKYLPNYKNPCWEWTEGNSTRVRCLPYFHLVGVDKCGTTDLWGRIRQHPQILPNAGIGGKETHWWSWRRFGFDIWVEDRTPWTFENYLSVFDAAASKIESVVEKMEGYEDDYHPLITGEGSPTVFWDFTGWDHMPQNKDKIADDALSTPDALHHLTPSSYFLLLLRNPTERMYSDYMFLDLFRPVHNISAENFHHGVIKSIKMFEDCKKIKTLKGCLYDKQLHMDIPVRIFVGMYVVYLKEWFEVFEKDRFLIFKNEEYSKDIKSHVQKVFQFLDLNTLSDEEMEKIVNQKRAFDQSKTKKSTGPMWQETRQILDDLYRSYNEELAELLADNKYLWKDDSK